MSWEDRKGKTKQFESWSGVEKIPDRLRCLCCCDFRRGVRQFPNLIIFEKKKGGEKLVPEVGYKTENSANGVSSVS